MPRGSTIPNSRLSPPGPISQRPLSCSHPEDPAADYRVRIFTPYQELSFAGHPTLGSCVAWLHSGGVPSEAGLIRQECGIGIVDIDSTAERLAFVAPPTSVSPLAPDRFDAIAGALGIPLEGVAQAATLDNGPVWQVLDLGSAEEVLEVDRGEELAGRRSNS